MGKLYSHVESTLQTLEKQDQPISNNNRAQVGFDKKPFQNCISIIDAAILELKDGNAGAHWEQEVIDAAREIHNFDLSEFYRKRNEIKTANKEAQITAWTKAITKDSGESEESSAKADQLVMLVRESCDLFHDASDESYATFEQDEHFETWVLGSDGFKKWLSYKAFCELGFTPSETAFSAALSTLKGFAIHEGDEQQIYLRCAPIDGGYLIDQTNDDWTAIRVTAQGWEITSQPEKKFIRSSTAIPLPDPVEGDFSVFWRHVNIPDNDRPLLVAWLLESWRPQTPYAILELCGEQGSAKSTTHTRIRQLSDPNRVPLRTAPKDTQDIFVSAANNHQASFENMSNLSGKMQDALCTLSTGGGFAARKLYSDADESVIEVKRPVIINGISAVATRPDLIDRVIHLDLPRIEGHESADKLDQAFNNELPEILGGLLTLFSNTLKALPEIKVTTLPRLADFALLGEAVHRAMGINKRFTTLFRENRAVSLKRSLESSPIAMAIQQYINPSRTEWEGTVQQLKSKLDKDYHQPGEGWPRSAKGLSEALRRSAPALREIGVGVEFHGHKRDGSHISLKHISQIEIDHHNDHIVTSQVNSEENLTDCDGVTDVTVDSEKPNNPETGMPDQDSESRVVVEI